MEIADKIAIAGVVSTFTVAFVGVIIACVQYDSNKKQGRKADEAVAQRDQQANLDRAQRDRQAKFQAASAVLAQCNNNDKIGYAMRMLDPAWHDLPVPLPRSMTHLTSLTNQARGLFHIRLRHVQRFFREDPVVPTDAFDLEAFVHEECLDALSSVIGRMFEDIDRGYILEEDVRGLRTWAESIGDHLNVETEAQAVLQDWVAMVKSKEEEEKQPQA